MYIFLCIIFYCCVIFYVVFFKMSIFFIWNFRIEKCLTLKKCAFKKNNNGSYFAKYQKIFFFFAVYGLLETSLIHCIKDKINQKLHYSSNPVCCCFKLISVKRDLRESLIKSKSIINLSHKKV